MIMHSAFISIIQLFCVFCVYAQNGFPLKDEDYYNTGDEAPRVGPSMLDGYDDYDDYEVDTNVLLKKCKCQPTEVLDNGKCRHEPKLIELVEKSPFNATVQDVECPKESAAVTLSQNSFQLSFNGQIFIHSIETYVTIDSFCVEDVYDQPSDQILSYAKICLAAPTLPKCCKKGENAFIQQASKSSASSTSSVKCLNTTEENLPMNLPIHIDDRMVIWDKVYSAPVQIHCPKDYELVSKKVGFENSTAFLIYGPFGVELKLDSSTSQILTLQPQQFCLDEISSDVPLVAEAFFCYRDPMVAHKKTCEGHNCVRKCCMEGEIFIKGSGCEDFGHSEAFEPAVYDIGATKKVNGSGTPSNYRIVYGMPICPQIYDMNESGDISYSLSNSGNLHPGSEAHTYTPTEYCLDRVVQSNGSVGELVLLCFKDEHQESACYWEQIAQVIAIGISCFFIFVTLFVYLSVPEILRRLPSKCVVSESVALLVSFFCLIALQVVVDRDYASPFCITVGLLFYFSTLASFFWLNVLCFDMYCTIRSIIPVNDNSRNKSFFIGYSAYAWGLPLVCVVAAVVCDNLPSSYKDGLIRGNFFTVCYIPSTDYVARWTYLYGLICLLLLINLILFILVAVDLVRQKLELAKVLQSNDSQTMAGGGKRAKQTDQAKESALLCFKLFLVMGITWMFELLSFAFGDTKSCFYWLFTDIVNCLRGFYIFFIFAFKKDVRKKFKVAWRPRILRLRTAMGCPPSSDEAKKRDDSSGTRWFKKRSEESTNSSSFWSPRKTSSTSLSFFSSIVDGAKRKVSSASLNPSVPELQKMETFKECDEFRNDECDEQTQIRESLDDRNKHFDEIQKVE